jgi:hypothetical protein
VKYATISTTRYHGVAGAVCQGKLH